MTKPISLNVSQTETQRIFVGLGWDPKERETLMDKLGVFMGKHEAHHDLDLACYTYNPDGECLGYVNADKNHSQNPSGSIYHSGDSVEGIGDGDDEQISVELKNLPPNVHHILFKVSIKSGHHFGEVLMPEIRLCDGYTERVFLYKTLEDGKERDGYVFAHLYRHQESGEWVLKEIHAFDDHTDPEGWKDTLKAYL
ncbi:MAG: TerD family protein [Bdellovibrionales bacterium]